MVDWTAEVEHDERDILEALKPAGAGPRELWMAGSASDRVRTDSITVDGNDARWSRIDFVSDLQQLLKSLPGKGRTGHTDATDRTHRLSGSETVLSL